LAFSFPPALLILEAFAAANDFGVTVDRTSEPTDDFEVVLFGRNLETSFATRSLTRQGQDPRQTNPFRASSERGCPRIRVSQ
jgi:hypothetical protein